MLARFCYVMCMENLFLLVYQSISVSAEKTHRQVWSNPVNRNKPIHQLSYHNISSLQID